MSEVSLWRLLLTGSRDDLAGVSKEEDERSGLGGDEGIPCLDALRLLPVCVVGMLLPEGVRVALGLLAERVLEADLREAMAESDAVFLSRGRFLGTSDKPASTSKGLRSFLAWGVRGGAVLCRRTCSLTGECRSWLSFRAREFNALDAALTDMGEGRE